MTEDDAGLETAKTTTAGDPSPPDPAPETAPPAEPAPELDPPAEADPMGEPDPVADDEAGFDEDDEDDETFEALREQARTGKVVPLRDANGNVFPARPSSPRSKKGFVLDPPTPGQTRYVFQNAGNEPRTGLYAVRKLKRERAAAEAMQLYYDVLTNPKATAMLRMMAADRLLDRIEGKPVSRTAPKGKVETVDEMRELDPKLMTEAERDQIRALCERQLAQRKAK